MKLYQILCLSLLIILPYLVIQNELYSYFYLLLSKILNNKLNEKAIKILILCYIILFYIILSISIFQIFLFEIIAGILTIFNAIIFYKPFFTERNKIISYFPTLDNLYILFLGIFIFIKGIIRIIEKIREKNYRWTLYSGNYLNESFNIENKNNPKLYTKINETTIEMTENALVKNIIYFLEKKQREFGIYNFEEIYLDIEFINSTTIKITIKDFYMDNIKIKDFEGIFSLGKYEIKIKEIKKGDISLLSSCIKSIFIRIFPNSNIVKNTINEKLNNFLYEEREFEYDNTFKVKYKIENIEINGKILNITLGASIDKKQFCEFYRCDIRV